MEGVAKNDDRLEAAVRAKAEAAGEGPTYELRGTTFTFPALADVAFSHLELLEQHVRPGLTALLDGQAEKFWEMEPSALEVLSLRDLIVDDYTGMLAGESPASRATSKRTSKRSRQPSSASTAKT
jgi:hypothetical protein